MYKFRITDGATHAEEFSAAGEAEFRRRIIEAFRRFRSQRPGARPLKLHAWDGEWWVDVRDRRNRPVSLTERAAFSSAGPLWSDAERTAWGANHMASQIGQLVEFLAFTPAERREHRRNKLALVHGGRDG